MVRAAADRLEAAFAAAARQGRAALIPYVTAGYPDLAELPAVVAAVARAGADVVEIGIPFSDPLADGPVLQRAATEAIRRGTRVAAVLEAVAGLAPGGPPVVLLTYINPVLAFGLERFLDRAREAGVCGLVIPDLPWVEAAPVRRAARARGLALVPLVAPTSTGRHLRAVRGARGFVYAVSVTGVTGARAGIEQGVGGLVERIRAHCRLPVAVGFGIADAEQVRAVARWADGVIVGSALVERMGREPRQAAAVAEAFVAELARGLSRSETALRR